MSSLNPGALNPRHVRANFDRAASQFAGADFVHRATAEGLLQRLQPMTVQPLVIADLGCALGAGSIELSRRFPRAKVLSIDLSAEMLTLAKKSRRWFSKQRELQADAMQLPLASGSVDFVFANMLLPWINDPPVFLAEVARVLRVDGVFMFSTLGPDSLEGLRTAWSDIDDGLHVHHFADMHNLGDSVMHSGLSDPVLDIDSLSVTYRNADTLFSEMAAAGARNCLHERRHTLTGKNRIKGFRERLRSRSDDGVIELKLELVYGHAFGKGPPRPPGDFLLAPEKIGRRRV
jgi:malonyl-CoA O-methyltransferase